MEERKNLVNKILEHQRNIMMLKQFIRDLESEGTDTSKMKKEIEELERKIAELQTRCAITFLD
jgi:predicted RNase H-like nuclease (RuvC/YqgF family)